MSLLLISLGVLVFFVLLTLGEAWFVKHKLGVDIVADIKANFDSGMFAKGMFKASGVVAFVIIQPFVLTLLLSRVSDTVAAIIIRTGAQTLTTVGGDALARELVQAINSM